MSNVAYYVTVTEYESGWGCRPDGYIVCLNKEFLIKVCEKVNSQQGQEYSRTDKPKLCLIDEDMYQQLIKNKHGSGYVWTGNSKSWLKDE